MNSEFIFLILYCGVARSNGPRSRVFAWKFQITSIRAICILHTRQDFTFCKFVALIKYSQSKVISEIFGIYLYINN